MIKNEAGEHFRLTGACLTFGHFHCRASQFACELEGSLCERSMSMDDEGKGKGKAEGRED